jgi:hypothetical protein
MPVDFGEAWTAEFTAQEPPPEATFREHLADRGHRQAIARSMAGVSAGPLPRKGTEARRRYDSAMRQLQRCITTAGQKRRRAPAARRRITEISNRLIRKERLLAALRSANRPCRNLRAKSDAKETYLFQYVTVAATVLAVHRHIGRPWLRAGARCPALRLVHSAGVARIALLIGRVRRLSRSSRHGGAPGERQDDEERGKASRPVHQSPRPANPSA